MNKNKKIYKLENVKILQKRKSKTNLNNSNINKINSIYLIFFKLLDFFCLY